MSAAKKRPCELHAPSFGRHAARHFVSGWIWADAVRTDRPITIANKKYVAGRTTWILLSTVQGGRVAIS